MVLALPVAWTRVLTELETVFSTAAKRQEVLLNSLIRASDCYEKRKLTWVKGRVLIFFQTLLPSPTKGKDSPQIYCDEMNGNHSSCEVSVNSKWLSSAVSVSFDN